MRKFASFTHLFIAFILLFAQLGFATGKTNAGAPLNELSPEQVVERITKDLFSVAKNGKQELKENPDKYFSDIKTIMEPAVNFRYIAKGVMGKHWEKATPQQREKFVESFKNTLVKTYAKGMTSYVDLKITVLPPKSDAPAYGRTKVIQKVSGPGGTNQIAYSMARKKDDNWQLINVILDGVNLGWVFSNQFDQSVKKNNGDIEASIDSWSANS